MTAGVWPVGEDGWVAYAKELQARLARLQLHVQPSWLYVVCTGCGWELEAEPYSRAEFRHSVATHVCAEPLESWAVEPPIESRDVQMELF